MEGRPGLGGWRPVAPRAHARRCARAKAVQRICCRSRAGSKRPRIGRTQSLGSASRTSWYELQLRSSAHLGGLMISLAGKAAVITGGSRGIGAAAVKLFARAGADVVFNYHKNKEAAAQVELEARKNGTRVESIQADLGKMAGAKKLIEFDGQRLGRIDVLVANA